MNAILDIQGLTTRFDTFEHAAIAVHDLDLQLRQGEMLGVVGGTGSGKSVLLKSIMNLVPYPGRIAAGSVRLEGQDLIPMSEDALRAIRGKDISLILPNPRTVLNPLQPVGDQVAKVMRMHQRISDREAQEHALEMFRKVNIPDARRRLSAYPHELSGGMCQRIVIAMALINSPKVLLADEISSGLDVTVQRQIFDLLSILIRDFGSSTIVVTRDFGVVANYCNRIAVMADGVIVEMDDVRTFFDRAQHPVSLHLLRSTFAAKGRREAGEEVKPAAQVQALVTSAAPLVEVEPGHWVRPAAPEAVH